MSQRFIPQILCRNNFLSDRGLPLPKATSTGTTIVGCLFKDGIVLGADTRATEGDIVADKNCEKVSSLSPPCTEHNISPQIHYITESIRCCGAGTAADTEFTTAMISSNMELHALSTGRKPRVVTAMNMLKQYLFRSVARPFVSCPVPHIHTKVSRSRWRRSGSWRSRRHGSSSLHDTPPRFDR
jgi:20S proteasome alpha/beta subunit